MDEGTPDSGTTRGWRTRSSRAGRTAGSGRAWAALSAAGQRDVVDGHRLAYLAEEVVNWCPGLGTVLADEEVTGEGRSAVGNYPVHRRPLRQWLLRITAFAERLLAGLDEVDWPENIKRLQRNWIGPSGGPYRLRDWLFSRQRYWGEPFPIVYDEAGSSGPIALPEEMLPVTLPDMTGFRPVPREDASDPVPAMSPRGVDLYVGGAEHAVLHLLYARFWHQVLYDIGAASTAEPFGRLFNQG